MIGEKTKRKWPALRKFFNDIHLWMGLASGIILFLVCLSGTIYTFSTEIQELIEPAKYKVETREGQAALSAEHVIARVEDSLGAGHKVQSLQIPDDTKRSWQVSVKKVEKKGSASDTALNASGTSSLASAVKKDTPPRNAGRATTYLVNPYTGTILGSSEGPASGFFMWMFRMHRWLLLDTKVGRPIVGVATIIFTFLVITGLIIWFPKRVRSWKQGLKIRLNGNWKRVNHDLHNTLGFYSFFLLLIMSLTGLTWSFEWYREGFHNVLGAKRPAPGSEIKPVSKVPAGKETNPASVATYLRSVSTQLNYKGDTRILLPSEPEAVVTVTKTKTGFIAGAGTDRLILDQYSGVIVKKEIFADKTFGEKISSQVKALHVGSIFGTFSKILYFIACLIATSLPVTGTLIWINKLRKRKTKSASRVEKMRADITV